VLVILAGTKFGLVFCYTRVMIYEVLDYRDRENENYWFFFGMWRPVTGDEKWWRYAPWLRQSVAGLQPRRPGSIPFHSYGICNGRTCGAAGCSKIIEVFPCHYSFINSLIHSSLTLFNLSNS
jgi:hypothetical protein